MWGLSASLQHRPHLQSFFMGYRDGVLGHPALRRFWSDVRVESRKAKIVRYNELGLSEALDQAGIAWSTMFAPEPGGPPNPTINDWRRVMAEGFPFVKAEVVFTPPHWLADWEEIAPATRARFGQDLRDWIPPSQQPAAPVSSPAIERIPRQARSILDTEGARGLVSAAGAYVRRRLG